jgi:hypothetical protein
MRTQALFFMAALLVSAPAGAETFDTNINVKYGQASQLTASQLDAALSQFVRTEKCEAVKANQYRCGEIPFGKIIDEKNKLLFSIKVKNISGRKGDVDYHLKGDTVPVYFSRGQRRGTILLPDLDTVQRADIPTSKLLGKDVFLQLVPRADKGLNLNTCLNLPGATIHTGGIVMEGSMHKRMPWYMPDIYASLSTKVNTGRMSFDSARACMSFHVAMDAKGLPVIDLEKISPVRMENLENEGLKVSVSANVKGIWGFLDDLLDLDIENTIVSEVRKEATKVARDDLDLQLRDVRNGKWFAKYLNAGQISHLTEGLSAELRKQFKAAGLGKAELEHTMETLCLKAAFDAGIPVQFRSSVFKLCRLAPKIRVKFFVPIREMSAKGCYKNYFRPLSNPSAKWWAEGCAFSNTVSIKLDTGFKAAMECFITGWNTKMVSPRCVSQISDLLKDMLAGKYDTQIAQLHLPPAQVPTPAEIETYRKSLKQLGVNLPPVSQLLPLWQ